MSLLSVKDLSVCYATQNGVVTAVNQLSFDLEPGETLGLAGESGSGKSTVAKAIMRILQPPGFISGGEVWINERNILDMNSEQLRLMRWTEIAMVFQSALDSLNPVLRIENQFQDLARVKEGRNFSTQELKALFELVDLDDQVYKAYPHQLSGGMRQRVGIALALALKPKVLILDEPTTALDVVVQRHILKNLKAIQANFGFSLLFITHDLPVLMAMSHRIGIMKDGELCEIDTPDNLRNAPKHPYSRHLLGSMRLLKEQSEHRG